MKITNEMLEFVKSVFLAARKKHLRNFDLFDVNAVIENDFSGTYAVIYFTESPSMPAQKFWVLHQSKDALFYWSTKRLGRRRVRQDHWQTDILREEDLTVFDFLLIGESLGQSLE